MGGALTTVNALVLVAVPPGRGHAQRPPRREEGDRLLVWSSRCYWIFRKVACLLLRVRALAMQKGNEAAVYKLLK